MSKRKSKLSMYDSSELGTLIMFAVVLGTLFVSYKVFLFSDFKSWIVSGLAGVIVGLIYNLIAEIHGMMKIHFLDFLSIDILPWR